jgi:hypothetical protein
MATTPNYGWVMPDPTDFVTDLPADFEIFGDAVDTTLEAIETKLDVITTEGDLVVGDASGDPVRLPIGTVGQVLLSDGDTAEWGTVTSGGYFSLASGTLSGTELSITSIPSGYEKLVLVVKDFRTLTTDFSSLRIRINNISAASSYRGVLFESDATTVANQNDTEFFPAKSDNAPKEPASANSNYLIMEFPNYAQTVAKVFTSICRENGTNEAKAYFGYGSATAISAAITSLQIRTSGAVAWGSGTYEIYGVK